MPAFMVEDNVVRSDFGDVSRPQPPGPVTINRNTIANLELLGFLYARAKHFEQTTSR